jgi:hypothetical protein
MRECVLDVATTFAVRVVVDKRIQVEYPLNTQMTKI